MAGNPKYIYIKGHSQLEEGAGLVERKPGVGYVYLAPPGVTCYAGGMRHIKDPETQGVRVLGIDQVLRLWSQIPEDERMNTRNRREFFRILRYLSMDVSGGVPVGQPCVVDQAENQMFSFTGGAGASGPLGVFDLDMLNSNPQYLNYNWFINENVVPPSMPLSHIVELVRRKYPTHPLIFLISGCRQIVDASGGVARDRVDEVWTMAAEFKGRVNIAEGSPGTGVSFLARMRKRFPIFMREYDASVTRGVFGDVCELGVAMEQGSGEVQFPKPPISAATATAAFGRPGDEHEEKPIIASPERMPFVPISEDIDTGAGEMEWEGGKLRGKRNNKRRGKPKSKRKSRPKSKRSKLRGKSKQKTKKKIKK